MLPFAFEQRDHLPQMHYALALYIVSVDNGGVIPLEMHIEQFADLALAPGAIRVWSKSSRAPHHIPAPFSMLHSHPSVV